MLMWAAPSAPRSTASRPEICGKEADRLKAENDVRSTLLQGFRWGSSRLAASLPAR